MFVRLLGIILESYSLFLVGFGELYNVDFGCPNMVAVTQFGRDRHLISQEWTASSLSGAHSTELKSYNVVCTQHILCYIYKFCKQQ